MMKKLIVLAIAAALFVSLATAATAVGDDNWLVQIRASNTANGKGLTMTAGTKAGGNDGWLAGEDGAAPGATTPADSVYIYSIDLGPTTPKAVADKRAPVVDKKVWHIAVVPEANFVGPIVLRGWNPSGTANDLDDTTDLVVKLYLGTEETGQLLWTVDKTKNGTSTKTAPDTWVSAQLPSGEYQLTLVAAIPEPGSIIALLTGLVGLYGIRRRR